MTSISRSEHDDIAQELGDAQLQAVTGGGVLFPPGTLPVPIRPDVPPVPPLPPPPRKYVEIHLPDGHVVKIPWPPRPVLF